MRTLLVFLAIAAVAYADCVSDTACNTATKGTCCVMQNVTEDGTLIYNATYCATYAAATTAFATFQQAYNSTTYSAHAIWVGMKCMANATFPLNATFGSSSTDSHLLAVSIMSGIIGLYYLFF